MSAGDFKVNPSCKRCGIAQSVHDSAHNFVLPDPVDGFEAGYKAGRAAERAAGYRAGLEAAAKLVCIQCSGNTPVERDPSDGVWVHVFDDDPNGEQCEATDIHEAIAALSRRATETP